MKRPNKNNYCNDDGYFTDKSHYIGAMDDYCNHLESQIKERDKEIVEMIEGLLDYWNQDRNDRAMFDALMNYETVLSEFLTSKQNKS